jgi:hypothetical protein
MNALLEGVALGLLILFPGIALWLPEAIGW